MGNFMPRKGRERYDAVYGDVARHAVRRQLYLSFVHVAPQNEGTLMMKPFKEDHFQCVL
ncbi:hypothetical protein BSNK01_00960 [Bacillaceae bacterium]